MSKNQAELFGRLEVFASSLLEETDRESERWEQNMVRKCETLDEAIESIK